MLLGGAFRGAARCVTRRARPRALFDDQGEQCLNQSVCRVCARGPRGRPRVVGWTKNEYCAAGYKGNAASCVRGGRSIKGKLRAS